MEGELDVWEDAYLNRHLGYAVLERVVVRCVPEVGGKSISKLLRERGLVMGVRDGQEL